MPRHPPDALITLDLIRSTRRDDTVTVRFPIILTAIRQDRSDGSQHQINLQQIARERVNDRSEMKPSRPMPYRVPFRQPESRSPFGHKTLFTMFKIRRPKSGRDRRHHRDGPKTVLTPNLSSRAFLTRPRHIVWDKLVEADGIEPTTSSLQS